LAITIFRSLVSKGFEPAYQEATTAAIEGMKNSNTQLSAISILSSLISKGFEPAYQEATTAATEGMKNPDPNIRFLTINLAKVLSYNPEDAYAWSSLGFLPSTDERVTVNDKAYSKKDCFLKALAINEKYVYAWLGLKNLLKEGETVDINGKTYSKDDFPH
jgi:hypothetical protein